MKLSELAAAALIASALSAQAQATDPGVELAFMPRTMTVTLLNEGGKYVAIDLKHIPQGATCRMDKDSTIARVGPGASPGTTRVRYAAAQVSPGGCPFLTAFDLPDADYAAGRRGRPRELLHHSDRGSQYTSEQCQRLMAEHGVLCSLSRSGNVWDNAAMESFFSSLKTERTARKVYRSRDQARADVFDYIERFYNPRRRHSTLGYVSPVAFEEQMRLA